MLLTKISVENCQQYKDFSRELSTIEANFEASEGKLITKLHISRERNRTLVKKKKLLALKDNGKLACEVCNFDFTHMYGELGEGFIECHHTKPISELKPNERTKITDLALVCANCHRMIHKNGNMEIEELKKLLKINFYLT